MSTTRISIPSELPISSTPNHGKPWTEDDECKLKKLFLEGASVGGLCRHFGRQPGGIVGRLRVLGLISYDGRNGYELTAHTAALLQSKSQSKTLEPTMTTAKLIESKTLILGREAEAMSDSEIFKLIAKTEGELASLKTIRTPSKKLEAHVAKTEAELKRLAEYVDSREEA